MKDGPGGRSYGTSALLQDDLGVEHGSKSFLVGRRSSYTGNAKVLEVHAELPSLDTGFIFPVERSSKAIRQDV